MYCFVDAPRSSQNPDLSSVFTGSLLRDPRSQPADRLDRHPGSIRRVIESLAV